jgi:hypothetical protein
MKWFMSYIRVSKDGALTFYNYVPAQDDGRHPVQKINDWNSEYGPKELSTYILLSFQQVADDVPECDYGSGYHF